MKTPIAHLSVPLDSSVPFVYGFHDTPFGKALIGLFNDVIVHLSFTEVVVPDQMRLIISQPFKHLQLQEDSGLTASFIKAIFYGAPKDYSLGLIGTPFQLNVWTALTDIPFGITVSYEHIAYAIGKPKAVRAVARAIAHNSIAYLIPCHRVIRKNGDIHYYRWAQERKKALLRYEKNTSFSIL
jgi:AraC family transcriptional regulator of adaptative response/methylated-DNA-[protein]-cysteine methyltransferase